MHVVHFLFIQIAVAVVGFERTVYTVNENEGSVEVCVVLFSPPGGISFLIVGQVATANGSATSMCQRGYMQLQV